MSFQKPPGGTRGARVPPSNAVTRALNRVAMSWHRRSGDKFQGQDLLYLTTVGAKTGQKRQTTVARFPDGEDAWLVVASAAGSATTSRSRRTDLARHSTTSGPGCRGRTPTRTISLKSPSAHHHDHRDVNGPAS